MRKVDADEKNPLVIYFANSPSPEATSIINSMVGCEKKSRTTPVGVCRESIVSDMDVTIARGSTNNTESLDKYCDKEITSSKTVRSCLLSGLAGNPEYRYTINIPSKNAKYLITIDTNDALRVQDRIKTIVETFASDRQ